ncbi:MAG: branched-chain amino acid ABC transporter permease [Anaerolineae bacterium]|nr:branched-chain amino acid ABC transporter permease [Anaerolineae bacterium]
MDRIIAIIQGIVFSRRTHIILLVILVLMPLLHFGRESCKDEGQLAAMIPEASCSYLIDEKPVTNATLLTFTQMFILIILASNWNLTGGFTGYIDFGHAVFFGIGAFATANLMGASRWEEWPALLSDWSFWPAMAAGGLVAALFALMIGSATLRLKGPYFSIAMLGTLVAVREIVRVSKNFSGGGLGLNLPIYLNRPMFYYLSLTIMVLIIGFISWLRKTEFGASLVAIREDEVGAEMRGINTTLHKIAAFGTAAFITGSVGGMWAYQNTFIDADIAFQQTRTIDMVMMSMLGGLGTVAGPVLGSTVMFWLRDVVWSNFLLYHQIFEGILLIIIVLFVPEGIMGMFDRENSGTSLNQIIKGWFPKSSPDEEDSQ